jgi:ubiquinone/menaquinone biosynthesis C-methylase UbiE
MESCGPIASHYDVLMSGIPYDMWVGYCRLLFAHVGTDPDDLLDVCCGTGSAAELFAKDGFEITGFDLSEKMIAEAIRKSEESESDIEYTVADAAELDLGRKFDGAYSFFDSLNYITDLDRLHMAIERVGAHIKPGGWFIFDVNTAYAFEQQMFDQEDLRKASKIRYKWKADYNSDTKIVRVHMKFWRGKELIEETHVQRAHSEDEIIEGLDKAGFDEIHAFDSYTLDPPDGRSDRIHYAARMS